MVVEQIARKAKVTRPAKTMAKTNAVDIFRKTVVRDNYNTENSHV